MVRFILKLPATSRAVPRHLTMHVVAGGAGELDPQDNHAFTFTGHRVLHVDRSEVFRGMMHYENYTDPLDAMEVVCKVAEGDAVSSLEKEAQIYTTALKPVWGKIVPLFICYCTSNCTSSQKPIACLVTRYSGKYFPGVSWDQVSPLNMFKAFQALIKLHRLGVCHNDFTPDNVTIDDKGRIRIVDFNQAIIGHNCLVANREYKLFEDEPSRCELNCGEIHEVSGSMDIWTPRTWSFEGIPVIMFSVTSAEDIVKAIRERLPDYPVEEVEAEAEVMWYNYGKYLKRQKAMENIRETAKLEAAARASIVSSTASLALSSTGPGRAK